jgi:tetratricopeptide (TPR) repeat protein
VKYGLFDDGFGPSKATPWRAGANETTTISFSHDVKVEGHDVKAGTYALFLQLEPSGPWTLILSSDSVGWGSFQYNAAHDVVRAPVVPQEAPFTEYLTYAFTDRLPNAATAFLQWENKRIPFKVEVPNVTDLYVAQIRQELRAWPGFNYQNWQTAASFAVANNVNLEEALEWANRAIYEPFRGAAQGREEYSTLATKASVLHALGRETDADTTMDHALRSEGSNAFLLYQYGMGLVGAGRNQRALEIFKLNRDRYPTDRFWPNLGLARGYTAVGDKKSAIASWEAALKAVPPSQANNRPRFEAALEALKSGR